MAFTKFENSQLPFIQIGLSNRLGVVMAGYSNRFTRMWVWDVDTLTVTGFQDIKAKPVLWDISSDGKYISYTVCDYRRGTDYMAVSHPPYFHALLVTNINGSEYNRAFFSGKIMDVYRGSGLKSFMARRLVAERIASGCPYEIKEHKGFIYSYPIWILFLPRPENPRIHRYKNWWRKPPTKKDWIGNDAKGREFWVEDLKLFVNGNPLIDLARPEFQEIVPPDWAKVW